MKGTLLCLLLAGCSGATASPLVDSLREFPDAMPDSLDAGVDAVSVGLADSGADVGPAKFWSCAFAEGPPNNNSGCICTSLYAFSDAAPGTCPAGTSQNDAGVEVPSTTPTSDHCCVHYATDAGVEMCGCSYGSHAVAQCQASGYAPVNVCPPP
jgi:hypothetical protein